MDQKGLIRAVAERTGLSREESADISRAVLEGLADQLSDGEARRLAADLPDLAEQLQARRRRRPEAHPVKLQDFIKQVSKRTARLKPLGSGQRDHVRLLGSGYLGHVLGRGPAAQF